MGQSTDLFPPSAMPQNEPVVTNDASFVALCKARIEADVTEFRWLLGNSILTRSEEFGLVWRADFEFPGTPSDTMGLVNRIVCWRPSDSNDVATAFLIGQHVPKLK